MQVLFFTPVRLRERQNQASSNRYFFAMGEQQIGLELDLAYSAAPAVVPELRDEIAQTWSLPLGQRVEVCLRGGQHCAVTGILELLSSPDYPWDPRQPLQLQIAGLVFSTRDIERWTRL